MHLHRIHFGLTVLVSVIFLWAVFSLREPVFAGSLMDHLIVICRELVYLSTCFGGYAAVVICIWSHALLRYREGTKSDPEP